MSSRTKFKLRCAVASVVLVLVFLLFFNCVDKYLPKCIENDSRRIIIAAFQYAKATKIDTCV